MKHMIYALALFTSLSAHAYPDAACMRQCTALGSQYPYCSRLCEQGNQMQTLPSFGTTLPDRACMAQCQAAGSGYAFCQSRCR